MITVILQLFQHYLGITDNSRKNEFFIVFSTFDRDSVIIM